MQKFVLVFLFCSSTLIFGQKNNPKVLAIYPTTDSIPVNTLRFYIQFSKPMQEMNILNHIKLTNQNGENITSVFFENQYELWNQNRTEVTLIVDPGRVKLGLLANNTMGRAFDEGKKYSLQVDSLLLDFDDQPLKNVYAKNFVATKEDRNAPNTNNWELSLPKANTRQEIAINFNDKIDHISAQTLLKIFYGKTEIKGSVSVENHEQKWHFKPIKKWRKGNYKIIVNSSLEDIAANSINQIFDHKPVDFNNNIDESLMLNFEIK